jgi:hypothetical protein
LVRVIVIHILRGGLAERQSAHTWYRTTYMALLWKVQETKDRSKSLIFCRGE